jgi:hypothetical protein
MENEKFRQPMQGPTGQSGQSGQSEQPQAQPESHPQPEIQLVDVQITNENTALNVMVGFLQLAQKRGAFSIVESAKIWECITKFIIPLPEKKN